MRRSPGQTWLLFVFIGQCRIVIHIWYEYIYSLHATIKLLFPQCHIGVACRILLRSGRVTKKNDNPPSVIESYQIRSTMAAVAVR